LGLHHAHELVDFDGQPLDIVHRDVSPLNVFVTFDGQTKVIDFGIAKSVDSSFETKTGVLKGRVAYMAPEQAWGHGVDRRCDVYSAGVMIWEAAAGRRLWPGMSDVEILARLLREPPPTLCSVRPDAPEDLEAICARAMERRPEERYGSTAELLEDLEAHIAQRDDAMSMREVGALVGRAFAEERRRTSALIDETLSRVRSGPRSGVMPTLEIHTRGTPSGAAAAEEASQMSSRMMLSSPFEVIGPGAGLGSVPANASLLASVTPPPPWWASRRAAIAAAGAAGLVVLVVVLLLAVGRDEAPTGRAEGALTAAALAPAGHDTPELVDLVVRVSPPGASMTIDGATVQTLPFHARVPKDTLVHHLAAAADGYEPKVVDVTFVNDLSVDVSLDRRAPPPSVRYLPPPPAHASKRGAAPGPSSAPAAPEPPSVPVQPARVDVTPAGGHAPLRPITTSNPYGNQ
ncbi:MAG TPA: protein kinase, partial [Polyangiaceae bacterium]